jgi:uncharacterized membrane-anchored protein
VEDGSCEGDIKAPWLLYVKGGLFVVLGLAAGVMLYLENPAAGLRTVLLMGVMVWGFCRAYYFAFYVVEHYVDPNYKFSGLGSVVSYWMKGKGSRTGDRGAGKGE